MPNKVIYLRLKSGISIFPHVSINIGEVADIEGDPFYTHKISGIPLKIEFKDHEEKKVLSSLLLVRLINSYYPEVEVEVIDSADAIIRLEKDRFPFIRFTKLLFLPLVCLLLFIGSAMAIMNFHADVSMPTVHQQIFKILTGEETQNPLIIQIPYSLGIGLGMSIFFNHIFHKKLNKEPSPLEVEMFLYDENVNRYLKVKENTNNNQREE